MTNRDVFHPCTPRTQVTDRDAKILDLYREGKMMKEIAAEVGMAANSIVSVLRRLGIERPTKPQKRWRDRPDDIDDVKALWNEGLCASQIAERLGRSQNTVQTILTSLKIRDAQHPRHRYDSATPGGSGRSGFAASMARKT